MAYNKTKLLEAAQKFLQMGKTAQAIGEFQLILRHEPKDQVTLMTVGDLYVRQGETFEAIEYFERLAQLFLADGFVAKAIAIYKKIAKLAPEETRPVERLADLYVQQGVLSEARPIYLRLAELHQRAGRHPQAAALLRKLLDAEPDNIRVQTRLAELSTAMGQPSEAAQAYRNAAEQLLRRGDHAEALKFTERALQADPGDTSAHVLKAHILAASGQRDEAVALLKTLPTIHIGGEASDYLLELYFEKQEFGPASELTQKLFANNGRQYPAVLRVANHLLDAGKPDQALPLLNIIRETMTDAGEHESLSDVLQRTAEALPKRLEPLEWLVTLYERASDSFRLPDAFSNLAAAYEAVGKNERARKVYEKLLERTPDDESVRQRYEKIVARIAASGGEAESEPEPEPQAAPAEVAQEPELDEATQQFVTQSLTDVDLFSSYGLTQKAIDLLEVVLQRAPRHAAATERLLDLYLGAGNERRTAELALELEHIHTDRRNPSAAERFAELHRRFDRAAASVVAAPPKPAPPPPAPQFAVPPAEPEPEPLPAVFEVSILPGAESTEESVHEVDLSEEWANMSADLGGSSTPILLDSTDEVAPPPAHLAPELLKSSAPQETPELQEAPPMPPASLPSLDEAMQALLDTVAPPPAHPVADLPTVQPEQFAQPEQPQQPERPHQPAPLAPALEAAAPPAAPDSHPNSQGAQAPANAPMSADDFLQSLSSELEASFPAGKLGALAPGIPHTNGGGSPAVPSEPVAPEVFEEPLGVLHDVFDQFRAELEELSTDDEDPETHYNLGIAYREMGLLEESISEFQKVAKASNHGPAFRYAMQCCTLLGLAFMEKGEPGIAAMWYERALTTPGLDQESMLALRYDLGVAQELAGETSAARKSFSQVYGMNIDYRDVAERLAALGKGL